METMHQEPLNNETSWEARPWWLRLSLMVGVGASRRFGTF